MIKLSEEHEQILTHLCLLLYCREQRVTSMVVAVLLGISIIAGPVLRVQMMPDTHCMQIDV